MFLLINLFYPDCSANIHISKALVSSFTQATPEIYFLKDSRTDPSEVPSSYPLIFLPAACFPARSMFMFDGRLVL